MSPQYSTAPANPGGDWQQRLKQYRQPNIFRGGWELSITALPFACVWGAMLLSLYFSQLWLYLLLILPAALLLIRLFMIQHDCGHGAFLPHRRGNDWLGRVLSILTFTPYDHWKHCHATHHATSGNLARRGVGDIHTLTVAEYLALSRWGRLCYRLYRHPAIMFGLGPVYFFGVQCRFPLGFMKKGWRPWISTMATNLAIAAAAGLLIWAVGFWPFVMVQLPIFVLSATIGVWLFYVQHQFDQTYWSGNASWDFQDAALKGSSYYDLPRILNWFTANIGVHHVHHLSSRIPYYRLHKVLQRHPELRMIGRISILQSLKTVRLTLWDEDAGCLVSFKDLRGLASA